MSYYTDLENATIQSYPIDPDTKFEVEEVNLSEPEMFNDPVPYTWAQFAREYVFDEEALAKVAGLKPGEMVVLDSDRPRDPSKSWFCYHVRLAKQCYLPTPIQIPIRTET